MPDHVGQQFGNYRLIRRLGEGGFAEVYLGEHIYLKSHAALKLLRTSLSDERTGGFLAEAQTLAGLEHPHIVRVLEFSVEQGTPVLVMEYARGGTLRQHYPRGSRIPLADVVAFIQQIAGALQYAHNYGVIHRDVKPENFLLNSNGQLLLSDFGLALLTPSPQLLSTQEMAGTVRYVAPEQVRGRPLFASDQYSLAIIAYEWLCGRCPFEGNSWEIIQQHLSAAPPSLREMCPEIPATVEAVLLRALSKNPKDRFAYVQGFAQALQRASQGNKQLNNPDDRENTAPLRVVRPQQIKLPAPAAVEARSPSKRSNRQRLLSRMHAFWIKGVLEQSLHGAVLIALGLEEQADAVANPWRLVFQSSEASSHRLPPGWRIIEAYDEADGDLLILGAPGSGKTTLLLELARDLLERAKFDESHPMPVIFNLSSWAVGRRPIAEWLVEELSAKYQVPLRLGQMWVDDNQILPLLDGLDEVSATHRAECIEAINAYRREHDLGSLVVCSRSSDYRDQPARIFLSNAVEVQPLTRRQIDEYLFSAGEKLAALRTALDRDPMLMGLASNPLMLSVLMLAYHGASGQILLETSAATQRQQVLATYIERMLQRRSAKTQYASPQIVRGLAWLAQQMVQYNQVEFYLERIQPDWCTQGWSRRLYNALVRLGIGLTCGVICMFVGGLAVGLLFGGVFALPFGVSFGLLFGLLFALTSLVKTTITPAEVVNWSWTTMWQRLIKVELSNALLPILSSGLVCALLGGLLLLLVSRGHLPHADTDPSANIVIFGELSGLLSMFLFGLFSGFAGELSESAGKTRPLVEPRPGRGSALWNNLPVALPFGLLSGLLFGLVFGQAIGLVNGIGAGLLFGVANGLLFGLTSQVKTKVRLAEGVNWLWRYVWRRGVKTELRSVMGIGLGVGLMIYSAELGGPVTSVVIGLLTVVVIRLLMGIIHGLSNDMLDERTLVRPNQGIWSSARNSMLVGLIFGIVGGLLFGLVFALGYVLQGTSLVDALPGLRFFVLIGGVISGLTVALPNGGIACIQHVMLRYLLWASRKTPWNYTRFLDHAADRILLRKVGGGYIFIHRLLLEHFAAMHTMLPQDAQRDDEGKKQATKRGRTSGQTG